MARPDVVSYPERGRGPVPFAIDPGTVQMIVELTTTDVAHGGYCVGRHQGLVVFVTGALPGETVRVEITGQQTRQWYGRVVEVVSASPDRVPHVWPLAERTGIGGADLGHVSPAAARRWKARVIQTQLNRLAHLDRVVEVEAVGSPEGLAWRTRLSLRVDEAGRLGMYAARSHQIVPVDGMPLAHEDIQRALARAIADGGLPQASGGRLDYVRASDSDLVARLRTDGGPRPPRQMVTESVTTPFGHWIYRLSADGVWQVHRQAPATLVTAVLEALGPVEGPVWDLYAGAGLFTLPLAERSSGPVTAVENSPVSAESLRRNTQRQSVRCLTGDVAQVLASAQPAGRGAVVCDPPRTGAGRRAVEGMARLDPDKIVYVACDPAALARDLGLFAGQGFELAGLRAFDLFPSTHHVECVAQLVRR